MLLAFHRFGSANYALRKLLPILAVAILEKSGWQRICISWPQGNPNPSKIYVTDVNNAVRKSRCGRRTPSMGHSPRWQFIQGPVIGWNPIDRREITRSPRSESLQKSLAHASNDVYTAVLKQAVCLYFGPLFIMTSTVIQIFVTLLCTLVYLLFDMWFGLVFRCQHSSTFPCRPRNFSSFDVRNTWWKWRTDVWWSRLKDVTPWTPTIYLQLIQLYSYKRRECIKKSKIKPQGHGRSHVTDELYITAV